MAASKEIIAGNVYGQPSKSNIKIRSPSRPVVSTIDRNHGAKPREVVQGWRVRESSIVMDVKSEEIQRLENEVRRLTESLSKAESTIKKLMKRDKEMSER